VIYLDTSVLIEHYLKQPAAARARELLGRSEPKVSSWLLVSEASVTLRRALADRAPEALAALLVRFEEDLQGVSLFDGFREANQLVLQDARFAHCRALDAIHVASAVILQRRVGHPIQMASFDGRLNSLAERVGLQIAFA